MNKKALAICFIICLLVLSGCGNSIKMKKNATEYVGKDYESVLQEFNSLGFQNVVVKEIDDLTSKSNLKDNQVGRIIVNGDEGFDKKEKISKDAEITIEYHVIPKLNISVSSQEMAELEFSQICSFFQNEKFENILTEEVYDLDPDASDKSYKVVISVNGMSNWNKDTLVPFDSEVRIVQHYAYEKYNAEIHINFPGNLLLNKYGVDLYWGSEKIASLNHGEDKDIDVRYKKGSYTLKFQSVKNASVSGTVNIDLSENKEASYKITCYGDYIDVSEEYVRAAAKEDETKVPMAYYEYESKNYKNVVSSLENAGFRNIQTSVLYDIHFGITDEESVYTVSINGNTKFAKGDIYPKDALIIVTYHMKEEDDPARIAAKQEEERRKEEEKKHKEEEARKEAERKAEEQRKAEEEAAKEAAAKAELEKNVPQEMAKRAVIVAMTNCQSTDVFKKDGYTYDEKKFHTYDDLNGMFLYVTNEGTWSAQNDSTWKVEKMVMGIYDATALVMVDCYVSKSDDAYKLMSVTKVMAGIDDIYGNDPSKVNIEKLDPSDNNSPFLTVPIKLIEKDRDMDRVYEILSAKVNHKKWVENQFSIWDGSHSELIKLVKKQLNDEKSFKHISTSFAEISDDEKLKLVNDTLKEMGLKNRASKGDLLIQMEFSAKNAFNATIKSIAIGVAIEKDNSIILIGIQ